MFTSLHNHSCYSLLDGLPSPEEIVLAAKTLAMPAVAITDHGNLYASYKFHKACIKEGILPILGQESYFVENRTVNERSRRHVTLLAKNELGWKNLMALTAVANQEGFYYRPRIDMELMLRYHEGIIALSGCCGGIVSAPILKEDIPAAKETVFAWKELFGDDFYFEIMPLDFENQKIVNKALAEIGRKHKIKLVATTDSHYLSKHDWELQHILFKIRGIKSKSVETKLKDLWFRTEQDVKDGFKQYHSSIEEAVVDEAIENTMGVANKIEKFEIKPVYQMPIVELANT